MLLLFLGGTSGSFKFQVQNRGYMHAVNRHACQALRKTFFHGPDQRGVDNMHAEYGDRDSSHILQLAPRGDIDTTPHHSSSVPRHPGSFLDGVAI